ncbi:hypothetical protein MTO96_024838 [Rhipicephalus appendiculatus]
MHNALLRRTSETRLLILELNDTVSCWKPLPSIEIDTAKTNGCKASQVDKDCVDRKTPHRTESTGTPPKMKRRRCRRKLGMRVDDSSMRRPHLRRQTPRQFPKQQRDFGCRGRVARPGRERGAGSRHATGFPGTEAAPSWHGGVPTGGHRAPTTKAPLLYARTPRNRTERRRGSASAGQAVRLPSADC